MNLGQRVSHPAFGVGVVTAVNFTGPRKRARVDFGYTQAWVVLEALHLAEEVNEAPTNALPPGKPVIEPTADGETELVEEERTATKEILGPSVATLPGSQTEARRGITALRLGQILEDQALQLSVGTADLQEQLQHALARALRGKPTLVLIDGAWGGGKTHALTMLQALARSEQMATGGAVMDGIGVTLSEPMQLMETIVSSIRIPGNFSDDGLGHVLRSAKLEAKSTALRARGAHEVANALDSLPAKAFDDPEALQCIEDYFAFSLSTTQVRSKLRLLGHESAAPPVLKARWVDDRPRAFAVLLKCWAQTLSVMGSRGLVVVLDELDVEYAATAYGNRASWNRRARRRALLAEIKGLRAHDAPLLVAFASAPAGPDVERDDDAVEDLCDAVGSDLFHMKAADPTETDLKQLLARLATLYGTAYPESSLDIAGQRAKSLFSGLYARYRRAPHPVPRHFVRTALEVFDLLTVGERPFEEVMQHLRVPN